MKYGLFHALSISQSGDQEGKEGSSYAGENASSLGKIDKMGLVFPKGKRSQCVQTALSRTEHACSLPKQTTHKSLKTLYRTLSADPEDARDNDNQHPQSAKHSSSAEASER